MMNDEEQKVMALVTEAMSIITNDWMLKGDEAANLRIELAAAVHAIQSFVIQHMLQRTQPGVWGEWYRPMPVEGDHRETARDCGWD